MRNADRLKFGLVISILLFFGVFAVWPYLPPSVTHNLPTTFAGGSGPITRTATAQVNVFDFSSGFGSLVNCCGFPALGMTITQESNGVNWVNATSYGAGAVFHGPGKNQTLTSTLSGDFTLQAILNVSAVPNDLARVGVFLFNSSGFTYHFGWLQYTTSVGVPQYSWFYGESSGSTAYASDPGANATWVNPYAQRGQASGATTFGTYENMAIQRHGTTLEWRVNGTEIASHATTASSQTGVAFVIQSFAGLTANPHVQVAYLGVSSSSQNVTISGVTKAVGVTQQNSKPFGLTSLLPSLKASATGATIGTAVADLSSANVAGNIYAIGGFTGGLSTNPSNVFAQYTPNNNTWTTRANYPQAFWGMSCADPTNSLSDKLYCFAGTDGTSNPAVSNNKYNFQTNSWSSISTAYPSTNITGFFGMDIAGDPDNGAIYLGGCTGTGSSHTSCVQTIWYVYTPGNNTFRKLTNMPTGTNYGGGVSGAGFATTFYKSNNVYLVGGVNASTHVLNNQVFVYNIPTNSWTTVCVSCFTGVYPFAGTSNGFFGANMNTGNSSTFYGVVGGEDNVGTNVYGTIAFYDPIAQTFTKSFNASVVPCAIEAFGVYTNSDEFYSSCTGTSGTQSNTATTTTYKIHFNFGTFWVPWYSEIGLVNWTTRVNGVSLGVNNFNFIMPGDLFSFSNPSSGTQPLKCTMSQPGPQANLTLTGTASPSPSFLPCDGGTHNFAVTLSPGATLIQEADNGSAVIVAQISVKLTGVLAGDTLLIGAVAISSIGHVQIFGTGGTITCNPLVANTNTPLQVTMASCTAISGGTYTLTGKTGTQQNDLIAIYAYEFKGSTYSFQLSNGTNTSPGSTSPHTNTISFPGPSYAIGFLTVNFASGTSTVTAGSGFTLGTCYRFSGIIFGCAESQSGASASTTFPFTLSVSGGWTDEGVVITGPANTILANEPGTSANHRYSFPTNSNVETITVCGSGTCPLISFTNFFQDLVSYFWTPPIPCPTFCGPQVPAISAVQYGASTNFGLTPTDGSTNTRGPSQAWIDNNTAWSVANPFYFNLLNYVPAPTSGTILSNANITLTFSGQAGQIGSIASANCFTDVIQDFIHGEWLCGAAMSYGNIIGVSWLFGIIALEIPGLIYLKNGNVGLTLLVLVAVFGIFTVGAGQLAGNFLPGALQGLGTAVTTVGIAGIIYKLYAGRTPG